MEQNAAQSEQTPDQSVGALETETTAAAETIDPAVARTTEELQKRLRETAAEAKQYRQRLALEKKEKEELQKKQLAEQGQFKELSEIYKTKAEAAESQAKKLREAFAMKTVADAVALEAVRLGCVDTEAILQLAPLDQIPIGEGFEVDRTHVKAVLEQFKANKPYLFQKPTLRIPDGVPVKPVAPASKPIEQMSKQEIEKLLLEKFKKGK